ncbi:hypothetical protein [Aliikangiella sp. IMCC44359]|uniref:hypothetical protein n=1 Tax=Aliikangiella sp. IMCC44359 TaxID=3459125 RepID=UPI00403A8FB7
MHQLESMGSERNPKGGVTAKGYWPWPRAGAIDFALDTDLSGIVSSEGGSGGYLERFEHWRKTGKDPKPEKPNGQFAYRTFAIKADQYNNAMKAINN